MNNSIFFMAVGFTAMAGLLVVFSRKMATSVFSLFAVVTGVALIYMALAIPMALLAQLILYAGAMMVLVLFALFLYGESSLTGSWKTNRWNLPKGFLLVLIFIFFLVQIPWPSLLEWFENQQNANLNTQPATIKDVGQALASSYLLEFEMVGMLLLAAMVVAGWFIYSPSSKT